MGLGAVNYELEINRAAAASVNSSAATGSARFSDDTWVPLLRAEYIQVLARHWRFGLSAGYVKANSGSISRDALNLSARLDYFLRQHVGLSLRYNYNDIDLDCDMRQIRGSADIRNSGPQLVASLRF